MLIGTIIVIGLLLWLLFKVLFVIGLVILFINIVILIIVKVKKRRNNTKNLRLPLILATVGISAGFLMQLPYLGISLLLKIADSKSEKEEIIDTGVYIYWEKDKDVDSDKYFVYNNRIYVMLTRAPASYMEVNEPIANIKDNEADKGGIIYTIKGCDDFSLLIVKKLVSYIYCDVNLRHEKYQYFNNIENYDLFITRTYKNFGNKEGYEITSRPITKNDYDILNELKFSYSDDYIKIPRETKNKTADYEYITIYGNSHDGIEKKRWYASFLVYNNNIYAYTTYESENFYATKLADEKETFILSLLE
jgi:hypothetical protein